MLDLAWAGYFGNERTNPRDRLDDGRSVEVHITAKGRRTYAAMNEEMMALQRRIFAGIGREAERAFTAPSFHRRASFRQFER